MEKVFEVNLLTVGKINQRYQIGRPESIPDFGMARVFFRLAFNVVSERVFLALRLNDGNGIAVDAKEIVAFRIALMGTKSFRETISQPALLSCLSILILARSSGVIRRKLL